MRNVFLTAAFASSFGVGACSEYLDRRETISLGAGDAQQANLVTHAVHPSPPHAAARWLWFDGARMVSAIERYRERDVQAPTPPTDVPPAGLTETGQ